MVCLFDRVRLKREERTGSDRGYFDLFGRNGKLPVLGADQQMRYVAITTSDAKGSEILV
jgi:hypothetical protein